jgi:hypothetical protein
VIESSFDGSHDSASASSEAEFLDRFTEEFVAGTDEIVALDPVGCRNPIFMP